MWSVPKTWVVGEMVTAAQMNVYGRDNLAWLYSGEDWLTPTIAGGWTAGSDVPKYRKIGNHVVIKGEALRVGTSWSGGTSTIYQLPTGYRPAIQHLFTSQMGRHYGGVSVGDYRLAADGSVQVVYTGDATNYGSGPQGVDYCKLNYIFWVG